MSIEPINPPGAAWPGLSQATLVRGDLLFLSGHVAADENGDFVVGTFEDEVRGAFTNLGRTLAAAGVDFSAIARLTYYLVDYKPEMIPIIKKVRATFLSQEAPPASVVIPVAALYDPQVHIEIEAIAVAPRTRE